MTAPFDHCQFDLRPGLAGSAQADAFCAALFAMSMDDPEEAPVMQLEGIAKGWGPPREDGYDAMGRATADGPLVAFAAGAHARCAPVPLARDPVGEKNDEGGVRDERRRDGRARKPGDSSGVSRE